MALWVPSSSCHCSDSVIEYTACTIPMGDGYEGSYIFLHAVIMCFQNSPAVLKPATSYSKRKGKSHLSEFHWVKVMDQNSFLQIAHSYILTKLDIISALKFNQVKWMLSNVLKTVRRIQHQMSDSFEFKRLSISLLFFFSASVLVFYRSFKWCSSCLETLLHWSFRANPNRCTTEYRLIFNTFWSLVCLCCITVEETESTTWAKFLV